MRKVLAWIVLFPLAAVIVLFAVANRGRVTVSLDPFSTATPAYAVELPMFLLIFIALILGVVVGGMAVWFGKLRWQLAANRAEKELARLKAERTDAERRTGREAFITAPPMLPPH